MTNNQLLINASNLEATLQRFAQARGWQRHHSPKNLAMALTGEVGELVELFQWLTEDQSQTVMHNPQSAAAVRDEIADVLIYLVRLSSVLGIDLNDAVARKLEKNALKHPQGTPLPAQGDPHA